MPALEEERLQVAAGNTGDADASAVVAIAKQLMQWQVSAHSWHAAGHFVCSW
jgi:hypothetical protein